MIYIPSIEKNKVEFDTLSSIPISPRHISDNLIEASYFYSLEQKHQ